MNPLNPKVVVKPFIIWTKCPYTNILNIHMQYKNKKY